eukprot:CAMPEP_0183303204 /NCGR_PEP_ID=MMETSP0160_2-20130417/8733_1 /TAXON_ID=2839 ORGANISM="Odontella Sinensis, Strain Grunow 1884" /NCGR_SAMPLE_ID=MMETSP0160_2 /ASSEMBLY_ACC=CAM_ASM_000250 /LENGTH=512 /DNA_ID=CAMNT_0025466081 /DNA_START=11 /DNA_END=1549 /DNA_ORIENTATION=+
MYGSVSNERGEGDGGGDFSDVEGASAALRPRVVETQISLPPLRGGTEPSAPSRRVASAADEPLLPPDEGRATLGSCVINLANTIVGAGMLGLPGAFGGTGSVGGTALLVVGAAFSAHGLVLLSKAAQRAGLPSSFYSVAHAAVPRYTILIDLAVALKCFGVATGYLITVGDCMVRALDHLLLNGDPDNDESLFVTFLLSRRTWVFGGLLAVLPVSFYRTLDELKKASALALVFVFVLAGGIVAYAQGAADPCEGQDRDCRGDVVRFTDVPTTLSKLPIFVFAFTCHQNVFPIVNEIQQRTQRRLDFVIIAAISFALVLFFIVAIEGYLTYGSEVKGDILLNYPETTKVTYLRVCIAFMLALHYPLQLDPSRRCITSLIKVIIQWHRGDQSNTGKINRKESGIDPSDEWNDELSTAPKKDRGPDADPLFYPITIAFLSLSFGIAMVVDDLGVVLAMVGATGSTLVSYVLPGLIYLKIHPTMDTSKILAYVQLYMGCLIMPVALYFVLTGEAKE